jgi:hypothetical protein
VGSDEPAVKKWSLTREGNTAGELTAKPALLGRFFVLWGHEVGLAIYLRKGGQTQKIQQKNLLSTSLPYLIENRRFE